MRCHVSDRVTPVMHTSYAVGMQTTRFASGRAENTSFLMNMLHVVQHVHQKAT